jgi:proteasome accessory factor A
MRPCIFGTETELALVVESKGLIRPAPRELASAVVNDVAGRYAHASSPPPEHRLFLANGSCIYADIGGHPEIATAECDDPVELAAQTIALRQMLAKSTAAVASLYGIPVRLVANNIDYAFSGAQSYGAHLNVLITGTALNHAAAQLTPLLSAMPIIAGAGKVSFATGSPGFELSQRAGYMAMVMGKHTTKNRAIITVKDEALSESGTRLHLVCFDTNKNAYQLILIPAIIAMTLKAVEQGIDIAKKVALADPVQSLHNVSCDPSLSVQLPLKNGNSATALNIHEHYISALCEFIGKTQTPRWFRRMLELWQELITNLRKDPFLEMHRLDWVAKLVIFTQLFERMGITWKEYSKWVYVLASVRRLKATWPTLDPLGLTQTQRNRAGIRRSALGVLDQYLAKNNLSWKDFPKIWNATNQLCRACLQYHVLKPDMEQGIDKISGGGTLLTGQMIEQAKNLPPKGTRAVIRGKAIGEAEPGATADWSFVQQNGRRLVMPDAFGEKASWKNVKSAAGKENR